MIHAGAVIVVIFASLLKGITGFGFALVSLPLLMIWYSPKELIPILLMCNLISSTLIILQKKETPLITKEFKTLIAYGGLFTLLGVVTLKSLSEGVLIKFMGVFFIALTLLAMFKKNIRFKLSNWSYKVGGAIIGFTTGSLSISGPPLVLFLNMAKVNNQEFREIFAWFNTVSAFIAVLGFAHVGMISKGSLLTVLAIVPILLIGTIIGKRLNGKLPASAFRQFSLWLTLFSSIYLLIK